MPSNYFFRNGGYIGKKADTKLGEGTEQGYANGIWTLIEQQTRSGANLWTGLYPKVLSLSAVGANTYANTTGSTAVVTPGSAGGTPAAGDIAVVFYSVVKNGTIVFTGPSGWSQLGSNTSSNPGTTAYMKQLTSSDLSTNSLSFASDVGASQSKATIAVFRPTFEGTTNTTPTLTSNDFEAYTSAQALPASGSYTINTTSTSTATNSVLALTYCAGRPGTALDLPVLTMTPNDSIYLLSSNTVSVGYNIFNKGDTLSDISYSCTDGGGGQALIGFYITFTIT